MNEILVQTRPETTYAPTQAPKLDRRRPGRIENASPELIALMRKPASTTNRVRVALYDAPGFLLPHQAIRPPKQRNYAAGAVAFAASSAVWGLMFQAMIWAWG